jgi:hypothetical protein
MHDLFAPGDELLTRDTSTGLEWLDVSATLGLSYVQAAASTFARDLGFRHASITEVVGLYTEFGLADFSGSFQDENYLGATSFIDAMGPGTDTGNYDLVEGWADLDPFDSNLASTTTVAAGHPPSLNGQVGISNPPSFKNEARATTGNFLVRSFSSTVVPELSSIAIWSLLAMLSVGVVSRR